MENNEAQVVGHVGQHHRGSANFQVVDEQALPAYRETSLQVTRTGLVDGEAAQRVATSGKEQLRQWNRGCRSAGIVVCSIGMLDADLRVACKHPFSLERVERRILEDYLAEV